MWALAAVLLSVTALAGQAPPALGIGLHSEGGGIRPGIHVRAASTVAQPLRYLSLRVELYAAVSRYELHSLNFGTLGKRWIVEIACRPALQCSGLAHRDR